MRETLADFLAGTTGYRIQDNYLKRQDDSVVAVHSGNKWVVLTIYPEEMVLYSLSCGRGLPSKLCERDLTNIGHC